MKAFGELIFAALMAVMPTTFLWAMLSSASEGLATALVPPLYTCMFLLYYWLHTRKQHASWR